MSAATVSDAEFIELWNTHQSASEISKTINVTRERVYERRRNIEARYKIALLAKNDKGRKYDKQTHHLHKARAELGMQNGVVIVFSDAHFWPGIRTTAFKGLLWAIKELKPKAIVCNGDAFDGASVSRFPRIGWDTKPSIIQELHACSAALEEIENAAKKEYAKVKLIWTLGNHDARFENRLAANAPEFEGVKGFTLKDHFPNWLPCWSCWPTSDVVVKHRARSGIHAPHNNTVNSGKSIVTGHLHSLKVMPFSDYGGDRFGVDSGTLADTDGPQFTDYLEDGFVNWRSGFAVLSFAGGRLLWPEIVRKVDEGYIDFRGRVVDVGKL